MATIKLGEKTTTLDSEGEIVEKKRVDEKYLNKEKVQDVLNTFIGKILQTPPMYSAIKVKGKKLYEYARKGIQVEIKPRQIEIYNISLEKIENNEITIRVKCSKGTYIRSLCSDIAEKLRHSGIYERT